MDRIAPVAIKQISGNDLYFMEAINNKLILNSNYDGVILLDAELETLWEQQLSNDFSIYTSFKRAEEIVLHCPDNNSLYYIDTRNHMYRCISLEGLPEEVTFLPIYDWKDNVLQLLSYDGEALIEINVSLNTGTVSINYPSNRDKDSAMSLWMRLQDYTIQTFYLDSKLVLVEQDNTVTAIQYENNEIVARESNLPKFHDVEMRGQMFVFIDERSVEIRKPGEENITILPEASYSFLRGKIMEEGGMQWLYLLEAHNSIFNKVKIKKYMLL